MAFHSKLELTRKNLTENWSGNSKDWNSDLKILKSEFKKLKGLKKVDQLNFAHCNTCLLELINRCESAYRSFRLGKKDLALNSNKDNWIIFVLTAHPTEARGPEFLAVFGKIAKLLEQYLEEKSKETAEKIFHLLQIILKAPLTRSVKPEVADEAKSLFNFALKQDMLNLMVKIRQEGTNVLLRTWAGGDKDGHPGVNEKTMMQSFHLSRKEILIFILRKLNLIEFELNVMKNLDRRDELINEFNWLKLGYTIYIKLKITTE